MNYKELKEIYNNEYAKLSVLANIAALMERRESVERELENIRQDIEDMISTGEQMGMSPMMLATCKAARKRCNCAS